MKLNELDTFPELGNTIVLDGNIYVKKQEPLSFEDLNIMWCGNPIDFARRIESIHGIGDE
jgi:hypothetical protein